MRSGWMAAGAVVTSLMAAGEASAQALQARLQDGRTFSIPASVRNCTSSVDTRMTAPASGTNFSCTVPQEDGGRPGVAGTGGVAVATSAQPAGSIDRYLDGLLRAWWPSLTAEQLASNKRRTTKRVAGGGSLSLICIHRDNVAALDGDAVCAVDQAGLQVIIHGKSTMASTADNVIDTILASATVR